MIKLNIKASTPKEIVNLVLLALLICASIAACICAFTVKPSHNCIVDGKANAVEYEYQVGSRKLNGRTFKDYQKVHLCKEDLQKLQKGEISLSYNKDSKTFSYKNIEKKSK